MKESLCEIILLHANNFVILFALSFLWICDIRDKTFILIFFVYKKSFLNFLYTHTQIRINSIGYFLQKNAFQLYFLLKICAIQVNIK